ncbi:MAG: short-chain dehydrogenase, partial [Actinomycetota bacterium]|nr:short-chain dehydrogenase [Actinomycetota bacterium]
GPVAGEFVQHGSGPSERAADGPYAAARARFQATQEGGYVGAQTPAEIAEVLVQVAQADAPVFRYQTSEGISKLVGVKLKDLTGERVTGLTSRWI